MKKLMWILTAACLAAMPVQAAEIPADTQETAAFADAAALYAYWNETEAFPDYFCGCWTETGEMDVLTFGMLAGEAGEQGMQEVLALIGDDSSVQFQTMLYSYAELTEIMEEISGMLKTGEYPQLYGLGIRDSRNTVEVYGDFGEEMSPETAAFQAYCMEHYRSAVTLCPSGPILPTAEGTDGDPDSDSPLTGGFEPGLGVDSGAELPDTEEAQSVRIMTAPQVDSGAELPDTEEGSVLEYGADTLDTEEGGVLEYGADGAQAAEGGISYDGAFVPGEAGLEAAQGNPRAVYAVWIAAGGLILLCAAAVIRQMRRKRRVMQTSAGSITAPADNAQTEQLIREQAPEPPESLRAQILEQIRQTK